MARRIGYLVSVTVAVALIVTASDALAQKSKLGKPETGLGTSTAARKYLEGRWGLVSFDVMPPGKPVVHLGGQGSLTYDGFGNMKWEVRIPPDAVEPLRLAGIPSNNGVLSMSGRTAIDMQAHTLSYTVQGQPPLGAPLTSHSVPARLGFPLRCRASGWAVRSRPDREGATQP